MSAHASLGQPTDRSSGALALDGASASERELERARQTEAVLAGVLPRVTEDAQAAAVLVDLSVIRAAPLGDPAGALEAAREAFRREPSLAAARAYRRAARRSDAREDLLQALEGEARLGTDLAERAALEVERGRLLEREVGNLPGARQAYASALELQPVELSAQLALLRLAEREGDLEAAIAHARGLADACTDPGIKAEYLARAARLCERAGRREPAVVMAVDAAVHAPSAPSVQFLLERMLVETRQWRELCVAIEGQIKRGETSAPEAWFELAWIARYPLGDLGMAERAFRQVAEGDYGLSSRVAKAELVDLYTRGKRATEAVAAAEAGLPDEATPLGRALAWTRIAQLREDLGQDPAGAAEAYAKAIESSPSHLPALEGAGRAYGALGVTDRILWVHRSEAEHAVSPTDRASALRRAGELLVADPARIGEGIAILEEALTAAPDHAGIFTALERALRKTASYEALCTLYEQRLARTNDARQRAGLLIRIGALAADRLDDPRRAIAAFRAAAEVPGGAPDHALARLAELLELRGELAELEPVLAQLTSLTDDKAQLASLAERVAQLRELRGDTDGAVEVYLRALPSAPTSHSIHASAGRAFARAGRWDSLLKLYEQAANEGSPAERTTYGYKLGVLLARRLGRIEEGIARLEAVRAAARDHMPTLTTLASLYEEGQRWSELRPVLAELPASPARRARLATLAELTGDLEEALSLWTEALAEGLSFASRPRMRLLARLKRWGPLAAAQAEAAAEEREPTMREHATYRAAELALEHGGGAASALALLAAAPPAAQGSLSVLVLRLRAEGDAAPATTLRSLLDRVRDPAFRATLCAQLAAGAAPADKEAALRELLANAPRDPIATLELEQLLDARHDRTALTMLLGAQLEAARADHPAATLRLGQLNEDLGRTRDAADAFERAAKAGPGSLLALTALPRLHAHLGDRAAERAALEALALALPQGPERAATYRRLAALHRDDGDPAATATALESALRAHPFDFDALRELEALVGAAEPERLIDPLLRAHRGDAPGPRRVALGVILGLRQLRAGRHDAARDTLDHVLADDGAHLPAHLLGAELETARQRWPLAMAALGEVAAHPDAVPGMRAEALRRRFVVQLEHAEDLAGAQESVDRLLALTPEDVEALRLSAQLAKRARDPVRAAAVLARLIEHPSVDEDRVAAHQLELAALQEIELGDAAAAIATLGAIRLPARRKDAVDRLLDLGGKTGRWDLTATALETTLDRAGAIDPTWEVAIRVRLARLLEGPLQRPEAATRQYERVVALSPGDVASLERLAELSMGTPERAITYHGALLESEPARLASYRALRRLFLATAEPDGAFLVEAVLEGLGQADEEEAYFHKQRRARLRSSTDAVLTPSERALLFPEHATPVFQLLALLEPALAAVFPIDFAAYGTESDFNLPLGAITQTATRMAKLFGIPKHRVVDAPNRIAPCVEPAVPPVLIIPRNLEDAPPREQALVLGELLARVAFHGTLGHPQRSSATSAVLLEYLLWGARALALPDSECPFRGRAVYEDVKARLGAAIPDSLRPKLGAICERLAAADLKGELVLSAMQRAAGRSALLASQDPALAIKHPSLGGPGAVSLESLSPVLRAVLPFAVSAGHIAMRRRLQLGVQP